MNEIIKQIEGVLRLKFPEYSDIEFQEMIDEYGEIIFLESMHKIFISLPNEEVRKEVSKLLAGGKVEMAINISNNFGVSIENIFEEISKDVVKEMLE